MGREIVGAAWTVNRNWTTEGSSIRTPGQLDYWTTEQLD